MFENDYDPGPKALKVGGNGKLAGEYPVKWYFRKRGRFFRMLRMFRSKKPPIPEGQNWLYDYLDWIDRKGRHLVPTAICRFCGERPVKWVAIRSTTGGIRVDPEHASCDDVHCRRQLDSLSRDINVKVEEIGFWLLSAYHGHDREALEELFDWAFELPRPFNARVAHTILREGKVSEELERSVNPPGRGA